MRIRLLVCLVLFAGCVAGCSTLRYYGQSVSGHMELMAQRRPVNKAIEDQSTDPKIRQRLRQAMVFRDYASKELHLPDNQSYRQYADLHRPYVVWNVVATPEFSLEPVKSCFMVVGCLSYRGYFDKETAKSAAAEFKAKGYDVYVGGVAAYSTLGWFNDPLLNTMLGWSDYRLAGLIFHELSHQLLYIDDDSSFNESFATTIEREGTRRWLASYGSAAQHADYAIESAREAQFKQLVLASRAQLKELFAQSISPDAMRTRKLQIYATLKADYETLKLKSWAGYNGYDNWFKTVNNAKLAQFSTYDERVRGFDALLAREGGDIDRFYCVAAAVGALAKPQRDACLHDIGSCPASVFAR